MEEPTPVIAYKPCGTTKKEYPFLKEENFLLILMTDFQAKLFGRFCELVCVDSTHKTKEYGYKLITLQVIDEFRKGKIKIPIPMIKSVESGHVIYMYLLFCLRATSSMGHH